MNKNQCLMIRTKDRRKFFTNEQNYDKLIEFSKVFNAEVSLVKTDDAEVLDIDKLIPAICNASYKPPQKPNYELVKVKIPQFARKLASRDNILSRASAIKKYVTDTFTSGGIVSLKELQDRFAEYNLSISALCNHVARVKKELSKQGKVFAKVGAGKYAIKT